MSKSCWFFAAMFGMLLVVSSNYAFSPVPSSATSDLYVATHGDNSHQGTEEQPLQTVNAARRKVRQLLAENADRDITVWIAGGTYFLDKPLRFSVDDSASPGHTITYSAVTDKPVILSGGQPIEGWRVEEGRWVVDLPEVARGDWSFRELFLNGQRATRARTPNEGSLRIVAAGEDQRTNFTFRPGDLPTDSSLDGAELVFLHDWSISRVPIERIDVSDPKVPRLFVSEPIGPAQAHYTIQHYEPHPRYFVEDAVSLLDSPGEWYLDRSTGRLTYLPREGESLEGLEAIAPRLTQLLEIAGDFRSSRLVEGLVFRGLTFQHCAFPFPEKGYAAGQATWYEMREENAPKNARTPVRVAIDCTQARRCVFDRCQVQHVGGSGLYLGRQCHDNQIRKCVIQDIGGNGLMVGEGISRGGVDDAGNLRSPELVSSNNILSDNQIRDCGTIYYGAVGIWVGQTLRTHVVNNEISHLPYTGISIGWAWSLEPTGCGEHEIRGNHIYQVMQKLSDGGGIYTLGRQVGMVLAENVIHDVPANSGRAESNGMFFDEGSSLFTIENNTIYAIARSPLRFHKAERLTVRKNRLVSRLGVPPFQYHNCTPETMTITENLLQETSDGQFPVPAKQ